eukprot:5791788-Prymnesium_polylepis.2
MHGAPPRANRARRVLQGLAWGWQAGVGRRGPRKRERRRREPCKPSAARANGRCQRNRMKRGAALAARTRPSHSRRPDGSPGGRRQSLRNRRSRTSRCAAS